MNNLKQLATAWKMFPDDNNGNLVPNGDETHQPTSLTDPAAQPGDAMEPLGVHRRKSHQHQRRLFHLPADEWIDCRASYHNGPGGLAYADGHAEIKRWRDPTVLKGWAPPTIQPGNA